MSASVPAKNNFGDAVTSAGSEDIKVKQRSGNRQYVPTVRLVLSHLQPQPTGLGGTLEFTINSVSSTLLDITRTHASQKTGGTVNQYQLTSN